MAETSQLNLAEKALRKTAAPFRRAFGQLERDQVKGSDVASDAASARIEVAKILKQELETSAPVYSTDITADKMPKDEAFWLVSPVSSWSNFSHGREPVGSVVIYVEKGEPTCAAAFSSISDTYYSTKTTDGAQSTNQRLRAAGRKDLKDCLFTRFSRGQADFADEIEDALSGNDNRKVSHNDFYADVLDLCGGKTDILVAENITVGEMAFAKIFMKESGCYATDERGNALSLENNTLLASNSKLHGLVIKAIK